MVIVQLTGGMGNQMFQYALGRNLAIRNNTVLKLDLNFFKTYEWHEYSLAPFNIKEDIASDKEINALKSIYTSKWDQLVGTLKNQFSKPHYIIEEGLGFKPEVLKLSGNIYLEGYWQSEKYFLDIEKSIREEFKINVPPSNHNQKVLDQINHSNSISLHVRRGVYATVPEVNKAHGLCSPEYYDRAVEYINQNIKDPLYFIFSDEIAWAKENLKINGKCVFVDQNDDKTDYEDIRMMSACKHNIMANSTFSWWASWLNQNKDKTIIAPRTWFADTTRDTKDIVPGEWIRL